MMMKVPQIPLLRKGVSIFVCVCWSRRERESRRSTAYSAVGGAYVLA